MDDREVNISSYGQSIEQVIRDQKDDECYSFSDDGRRVAVIIMNTKDSQGRYRDGSDIDLKNLENLFSYFNFEIRYCINHGRTELLNKLIEVSTEDYSDCDCLAVAISSHGDSVVNNGEKKDVILTLDHIIKTEEIMEFFTDKACPGLANKPRLFFIQACRGQQLDDGQTIQCIKTPEHEDITDSIHKKGEKTDGIYVPHNALSNFYLLQKNQAVSQIISSYTVSIIHNADLRFTAGGKQVLQEQGCLAEPVISPAPCYKDFLVMYATPPGFFAFRRPSQGSWFINSLTEVLLNSDGKRDLLRELTRVVGKVAHNFESVGKTPLSDKKKQTPVIYSMLSRDIYLKPKSFSK